MCVLRWGASLVPTVLGCYSDQPQAALWNLVSMHMCPKESANCEKGRENTEGLMIGKYPTLGAIYLNYWSVMKCTPARLKHGAHHTQNKLCVFNAAQRWQAAVLREIENYVGYIHSFQLLGAVSIQQEWGFLKIPTAHAQDANPSVRLRHRSSWVNLTQPAMALRTWYKYLSLLPFEIGSHFVA